MRQAIVVITGPTASGKSDAAIAAAAKIEGSIINADSVSVYQDFNIGASKPTQSELSSVPHYLVSACEPTQEFNAGVFCRMADRAIAEICSEGRRPIVAGGTGLYISSLLCGLVDPGDVSQEARSMVRGKTQELEGNASGDEISVSSGLHQWLSELDPQAAAALHPHDRVRTVRALHVYLSSGKSLAAFQSQHSGEARYDALVIALLPEREQLYEAIENRVDVMLEQGLIEEVMQLLKRYPREAKAFGSIGYSHVTAYLDQQCSLEQMRSDLKRDTRRFAKRQLTWWRNQPAKLGWELLDPIPEIGASGNQKITDIVSRFFASERPFYQAGCISYQPVSSEGSGT